MGWTAVTGRLDAPGLALFAILFLWQIPHFLAIATYRARRLRARRLQGAAAGRSRRAPRAPRSCSSRSASWRRRSPSSRCGWRARATWCARRCWARCSSAGRRPASVARRPTPGRARCFFYSIVYLTLLFVALVDRQDHRMTAVAAASPPSAPAERVPRLRATGLTRRFKDAHRARRPQLRRRARRDLRAARPERRRQDDRLSPAGRPHPAARGNAGARRPADSTAATPATARGSASCSRSRASISS